VKMAPLNHVTDTIAAVATPQGRGAISIVRLSGPRAGEIALAFLGGKPLPAHGELTRYVIASPDSGEPLDEGMVVRFVPPHTYTGEEVVEFHIHGTPLLVSELLSHLFELGARLAKHGEFTLRAFANGKKDLTQAEAIGDLISARSLKGLKVAASQLLGGISREILKLSGILLETIARLEAELDFPDDVPELNYRELHQVLSELSGQLAGLAESYDSARLWKEGYRVVLAGAPNVGKSSLFNALLGRERAIVTEEAGTTRDYLEEFMDAGSVPVLLVDTAGLRRTASVAEKAGAAMSADRIREANLVLFLLDPTRPENREDDAIDRLTASCARIVVVTKADLPARENPDGAFRVSALTGAGVTQLKEELGRRAQEEAGADDFAVMLTSVRQRDAVVNAGRVTDEALALLDSVPRDIFTSRLREALHCLNEVTGKGPVTEQILDTIFSSFCIGK